MSERERFEAEMRKQGWGDDDLRTQDSGEYFHPEAATKFGGWLACAECMRDALSGEQEYITEHVGENCDEREMIP